MPIEAIRQNFETNLFSLIALTQLVIPIMRNQGSGRIVNISSVAGRIARPLSSVYDATKHENARPIIENAGPYSESFERLAGVIQRLRKMAGRPEDIANVIFKALSARSPRARYAAPGRARFLLAVKRLLPSRVFDYVLSR